MSHKEFILLRQFKFIKRERKRKRKREKRKREERGREKIGRDIFNGPEVLRSLKRIKCLYQYF